MRKRSLCLALLLLICAVSEGCCWCPCNRPFLFQRWWYGGGCCDSCCATPCSGTSYFGGGSSCCGGGTTDGYPVPPLAPGVPGSNPMMPNATPLVRAQLGINK